MIISKKQAQFIWDALHSHCAHGKQHGIWTKSEEKHFKELEPRFKKVGYPRTKN